MCFNNIIICLIFDSINYYYYYYQKERKKNEINRKKCNKNVNRKNTVAYNKYREDYAFYVVLINKI